MNSELSDEVLLERYRSGVGEHSRAACLNELFGRHQKRLALWCLRITDDRETALDLAQEVLSRAFARLDSFRGQCKFSTWLYVIARNHCLNHLKSVAAKPTSAGEEPLQLLEDTSHEAVFEAIHQKGYRQEVWQLLRETLSEEELKVMVLHYAHEISVDGVTRLLRLENQSGAKAYIVSAKRKLAPALARWRARQAGGEFGGSGHA